MPLVTKYIIRQVAYTPLSLSSLINETTAPYILPRNIILLTTTQIQLSIIHFDSILLRLVELIINFIILKSSKPKHVYYKNSLASKDIYSYIIRILWQLKIYIPDTS